MTGWPDRLALKYYLTLIVDSHTGNEQQMWQLFEICV